MGKASSSKKIARAARAGGRVSGVRQRNLGFPAAIVFIVALGLALVGFAWNDRRNEAASEPPSYVDGDHWHAAYGFWTCGEWQGGLPETHPNGGVHTHGDDVIHIHPYDAGHSGDNATLGIFLRDADVTLTDDELVISARASTDGEEHKWVEGETKCGDQDGELVVADWENVQNTEDPPVLHTEDLDEIKLENGAGYTIAFVPEGETEDIPKPQSSSQLAELGAVDSGQESTGTTVTDEGGTDTSAPPEGEPTPSSVPAEGEPTDTSAPAEGESTTSSTEAAG